MIKQFSATLLLLVMAALLPLAATAQERIAYVDSEFILSKTPEYATAQQKLDRMAQDWEKELQDKQREVDEMFRDYQARELLFTNEERQRKREAIVKSEEEIEQLRMRYFGPEGTLFQQQKQLMRPIQERILAAIEEVAESQKFDYIFDKSGEFLFLFAREQFDVSNRVLEELGIDVEEGPSRALSN